MPSSFLLFRGDRRVVNGLALLPQKAREPRALLLGDVRAVEPYRTRRPRRHEQHVAAPEQLFCAVAVENRSRVDLRLHAERDARRQVRLDQAGDDVDRRPLCREQQVHADRARHLRQARDRLFDVAARHHHEVGELVDDDHDVGERHQKLFRLRGGLVLGLMCCVTVELLDVSHAGLRQLLVALLHLLDGPAQGVDGLLGIDDDRRHQMGDVFVHPELDALRVDHDQAHLVRRRAEQDARQHRVDRDRLARSRRPGDQQVGHRREVGHVRLAVNRLAERERQLRCRALVHLRLQQLAERDLLACVIRNLDADGRFPGNAIDEHRFGLHREAEIVGEAR